MIYNHISIGFAPELVPLINDGTKTFTYRLGDKYNFLQVGDKINIKDSSNDKIFSQIEIIEKTWILFKDLPIDKKGHEKYSSKEEQKETFKKYYKKELKDNDKILVLGFKISK